MDDIQRTEALCLIAARGRAYVRLVALARFGASAELDDRLAQAENAVLALNAHLVSNGLIPEADP